MDEQDYPRAEKVHVSGSQGCREAFGEGDGLQVRGYRVVLSHLAERMAEEAAASRASSVSDARKILVAAQHHVAKTDIQRFCTLWAVKQQQLAAKRKTGETWATLMQAALRKIRKQEVVEKADLDQLDHSGMPQSERLVFDISRELILDEDEGRLGKDKVKDLMVAMSGIVDLRTWRVRRPPSLVQANLKVRQQDLVTLLDSLKEPLRKGPRILVLRCRDLIGKNAVAEENGEEPSLFTGVIRAIEYLANKVEKESQPRSEQEWVDTWKTVLNCLTEDSLKLISGETVCKATTIAKKEVKDAFGIEFETSGGRKCDLLMKVGDLETLNSGAKVVEEGDLVETQYKKNLRINRAIWQHVAEMGVELPAMMPLDLRGRSGLIVRIEQTQDCPSIFYAGAAHEEIINLPTSAKELRAFMAGPAPFILYNYASWLAEYEKTIEAQVETRRNQRMTVLGKRSQVSENTDTETETDDEHKEKDGGHASLQAESTPRSVFSRRSHKRQQRRFADDYAATSQVKIGRISLFSPKLSAKKS
ncbi:hypothetical protein DFQ27_001031 [Actinomortierella ambigua]|uniref:Uncharacterized protein n=1 Tax=Actinomortierella ambigua TaxID=1343610 RepID=A0A9P6QG58_9FUNG|nr:hypothetical protein DFQ27_001031 [Actinomortierella ambigua]